MKTAIALIIGLCLLPLIAVAGDPPQMSELIGPLYVVGQADTSSELQLNEYGKLYGSLYMLKGPCTANDTLHLLFEYAYLHTLAGTTQRGDKKWKMVVDTISFVVSDSAVAGWPKKFTVPIGDSLAGETIRCRAFLRDDATTDSVVTPNIGASFLLNLRSVR